MSQVLNYNLLVYWKNILIQVNKAIQQKLVQYYFILMWKYKNDVGTL